MKNYAQVVIGQVDPALVQAAQQANHDLIDGLAAGDAARIAVLYGAEAQAFVQNAGLLTGHATFLAAWQGGIDQGVRRVTVEPAELVQAGSFGYETGSYAILNQQDAPLEQGHYLLIWRQEAGQWKWHRHIWNYHFQADAT